MGAGVGSLLIVVIIVLCLNCHPLPSPTTCHLPTLSCVVLMSLCIVVCTCCHCVVVVVVGTCCALYVVAALLLLVGRGRGHGGDTELMWHSIFTRCGHTTARYGFCTGLNLPTRTRG